MNDKRPILSVTEITRRLKQVVETAFSGVLIQGELSNVKFHTSGHLYFTLKDEGAQMSAVMWRSRVGGLQFTPEDGMKVVVSGRITVYEVRGNYQVDVSTMRPLGIGELQIAFEKLKKKLEAEGLFDATHKRPLPPYPQRIGIVTSSTGAALQDILKVLRRRFPSVEVVLRPAKVQGAGAAADIAAAIDDLNRFGSIDTMIVGRGGGSLEDLWPFNEEIVARAIYGSGIPIVSAVGHEVDFTIADFVADLRAPTPSAAASMVVPDRSALLEILRNNWYTMQNSMMAAVESHRRNIQHLLKSYSFNRPLDLVRQSGQHLDELVKSVHLSVGHSIELVRVRTGELNRRLRALDPELVLKRGFTIVYKDGSIVPSGSMLNPPDVIDVRFRDGKVRATVSEART